MSAQPLTILGVTGPFSVLAENVYELAEHQFGVSRIELLIEGLFNSSRSPFYQSWPGLSFTPAGCTTSSPSSTPTTGP